jgi:hypothetical protein
LRAGAGSSDFAASACPKEAVLATRVNIIAIAMRFIVLSPMLILSPNAAASGALIPCMHKLFPSAKSFAECEMDL